MGQTQSNSKARSFLEAVYRGLYRALLHDPALRKSMVMFLPYHVEHRHSGWCVYLHDIDDLGIMCDHPASIKFRSDNAQLIANAIQSGRDVRSMAHRIVEKEQGAPGSCIPDKYNGKLRYIDLQEQHAQTSETLPRRRQDDLVEYNVDSCPNIYPVLGVIRQWDGRVIGMVSMDFDRRLGEKVASVFYSYMAPFDDAKLWATIGGPVSLNGFHIGASLGGSWTDTFHDHFPDTSAVEQACNEICARLESDATGRLHAALYSAMDEVPDAEQLLYQHTLLKALQGGSGQVVPALWMLLGEEYLDRSFSCLTQIWSEFVCVSSKNINLRPINCAAGQLYSLWQWERYWPSVCTKMWPVPTGANPRPRTWVVLEGPMQEDPYTQAESWLHNGDAGERKIYQAMWELADALHGQTPHDLSKLVELRVNELDSPTSSGKKQSIVNEIFSIGLKTPLCAVLAPSKLFVAITSPGFFVRTEGDTV